jgi:hypothetical protein
MEVLSFEENEDGSATVELKMTDWEQTILLQLAITTLLKEFIEREKDEHGTDGCK